MIRENMVGMRRRTWAFPALLQAAILYLSSAVTITEKKALVYDNYPKIRIFGADLGTLDPSSLELTFAPKLKVNRDYKVDIHTGSDSDDKSFIVLYLQPDKRWMSFEAGSTPNKALYLASAKAGGETIVDESIQIATIVPAPTVTASTKEIYMTTTPKLVVNGTNFNTKDTRLFFDPPLKEGVQISTQVLSSTQISIMKNYDPDSPVAWTVEPGPLKVKGINTGPGMMTLSPIDGGVVVAEVQANLEGHDVSISVRTNEEINLYQSTPKLLINGNGFVQDTKIRFGNALRGGGQNFTITKVQTDLLTLELQEGSVWRRNPNSLPGALVALAAKSGSDWIPLGPTAAKAGRRVATVFEDPSIVPSETTLYRTHSHDLVIMGTGFNTRFRPVFEFEPYTDSSNMNLEVVNRTMLHLSLSSVTSEWTSMDNLGPLTIKGINTGAGMKTFESPIKVANVVADGDVHESGVQVFPSYEQQLYQSSQESIHIMGAGFKGEPVLNLDPPIWSPANYTLEVVSETELKLTLVKGSFWRRDAGPLMVKGINVGDGDVQIAEPNGIKVALIFEDPVVKQADLQIYASHTKHFPVRGTGFHSAAEKSIAPKILLDGIPSSNYRIQADWSNKVFYLELVGDAWLEVAEEQKKPIKLMSIDTGAGDISFPDGVMIAEVRPDSPSALCEDSCAYANDGQCDEPAAAQPYMRGMSYGSYYSGVMSPRQASYGWGYDDDANSFMATNDYSHMYRYAGYSTTYHYYGMTDDGFYNGMAPCQLGTDCSDCGVKVTPDGTCLNTCPHARDGTCDDQRSTGVCPPGTDCQDCGPWGDELGNFTQTSFYMSGSWYDDDWEFAPDDMFAYGQENNAQPLYKRDWSDHDVIRKEAPGAGTIFVDVLWAMVVLVGCSVSIGGCMVAFRHFKAGGGGAPMYLPVQAAEEVELSRRGAGASSGNETTPDVVRIG